MKKNKKKTTTDALDALTAAEPNSHGQPDKYVLTKPKRIRAVSRPGINSVKSTSIVLVKRTENTENE